MWSPFSRKTRRRPHSRRTAPIEHAWASNVSNTIATIDRIGPTAVATVMVPSLATNEGVGQLIVECHAKWRLESVEMLQVTV